MIASYEPFLLRYLEIDEDARIAAASSSKDSERTRAAIVEQRHFLGRIREWRNPSGAVTLIGGACKSCIETATVEASA